MQDCCATTGDGLTEGLDWLHSLLIGKAVKQAIAKPVIETGESVTKTQGALASLYNSISGYFIGNNT